MRLRAAVPLVCREAASCAPRGDRLKPAQAEIAGFRVLCAGRFFEGLFPLLSRVILGLGLLLAPSPEDKDAQTHIKKKATTATSRRLHRPTRPINVYFPPHNVTSKPRIQLSV